jgi:hypothetical protein
MTRLQITMLILAGTALAVWMLLSRCSPEACRALHIQTYTIASLDDYREFLFDEAAFTSSRNARTVQLHSAALKTGRLDVGIRQPTSSRSEQVLGEPIDAWHQGRLLHLSMPVPRHRQEVDDLALKVRESIAHRIEEDLSFLRHLFGGVVLHMQKRQIPIVLFSDRPCV